MEAFRVTPLSLDAAPDRDCLRRYGDGRHELEARSNTERRQALAAGLATRWSRLRYVPVVARAS